MNREAVIRELLERYSELVDPMWSQTGFGGADRVPLMPATYTASVRELERLLRVMRDDRHRPLILLQNGEKASVRSLWWHLTERYIRSTAATKDVPVRRRTKHRKTVTLIERQVVVRHSPAVDGAKVDAGIAWLAANWQLGHEPMLPVEVLVAA